ncbi:MAG: hypothetical protein WAK69_08390 [Rhodoplanes sp.]
MSGSVLYIGPAIRAVHIGERLVGPPGIKRQNALLRFVLARVPWSDIGEVDCQDVGDQDLSGMTSARAVGPVFSGEVLTERALGARAILCSAARADLARSVSDAPNGSLPERAVWVSILGAEP